MNTLPNRISIAMRYASTRKDTVRRMARQLNREVGAARFRVVAAAVPCRAKDGRRIPQWCLLDTRRAR